MLLVNQVYFKFSLNFKVFTCEEQVLKMLDTLEIIRVHNKMSPILSWHTVFSSFLKFDATYIV